MKPTTAANVVARRDRPDRDAKHDAASAISSASAVVMGAVRRARAARDELGDGRAREQHEQPDADQLEAVTQACRLRQQAEHHQPEAEIVGLGQRVQPRERIGEAQQADGAGEEEEGAGRDGDDGQDVERDAHAPSVR